jgi:hypothetical protein
MSCVCVSLPNFFVFYVVRFVSKESRRLVLLKIKSFTLCQIYLYQKDERALPGNLQTGDNVSCPPLNVVSLTTSPPHSLSLSLSLFSKFLVYIIRSPCCLSVCVPLNSFVFYEVRVLSSKLMKSPCCLCIPPPLYFRFPGNPCRIKGK